MILVELLVVLAVVAVGAYVWMTVSARRRAEAAQWRVATRTDSDGALRVVIVSPEGGERLVRELPPALDGPELTAELRLAREEAASQANELNRLVDR